MMQLSSTIDCLLSPLKKRITILDYGDFHQPLPQVWLQYSLHFFLLALAYIIGISSSTAVTTFTVRYHPEDLS